MAILDNKQGVQPAIREAFADFDVTSAIKLPMAAEADLAGGAVLGDVIAKYNALLGKLRTAGLLDV